MALHERMANFDLFKMAPEVYSEKQHITPQLWKHTQKILKEVKFLTERCFSYIFNIPSTSCVPIM